MLWSERKDKDITRQTILSVLNPNKTNLVMGLPGNEAIFEKMLSQYCKSRPHCVLFERDQNLVPMIKGNLSGLSLSYNLIDGDVDVFLQGMLSHPVERNYDLIWLDYCGPLTPLRLNIASKLHSLVNETGTYAFTFMMGREHEGVMNIIDALGSTDMFQTGGASTLALPEGMPEPLEFRVKTLLKAIYPACKKTKISILSYSDTVPMYVLIIQKGRWLGDELVPVKRLSLEWIEL